LQTANILPDAVIASAPATLTVTFTEETSPTQTRLSVTNASGARVDKNDLSVQGDTATIGLNALSNGVYTVTYHTFVEADSHVVDGEYTFTVAATGATTGSAAAVREEEGTMPMAAPKGGAGGMADIVADESTVEAAAGEPAADITWLLAAALLAGVGLWLVRRRAA
jgi:methionine-rich copper-binding protein CopC